MGAVGLLDLGAAFVFGSGCLALVYNFFLVVFVILLLFIYLFFSPRMLFFARLWRWVLSAPGERREPGWGRDLGLEQGPDPCLPLGAGHPERSRSGAAPLLPAAAAVPPKVTSEPLCLCGVGSPTPAPEGMLPPLSLTPRGGAESFSRARVPRLPL